MVKKKDDFESLAREIGQLTEREAIERSQSRSPWLYGLLLVTLILTGIVVKEYVIENVIAPRSISQYAKKISTESEGTRRFPWTYKDFVKLDRNTEEASKTSLDQVLEQFGSPTSIELTTLYEGKDALNVNYLSDFDLDGYFGEVRLIFSEFDGKFTLVNKIFYGLPDIPYINEVGEMTHDWTGEDLKSLKVGEMSTGVGGVTVEEVIERFGPPSDVQGTGVNGYLTITLLYLNPDTGDNVSLNFIKSDGTDAYRLNQKSGETGIR